MRKRRIATVELGLVNDLALVSSPYASYKTSFSTAIHQKRAVKVYCARILARGRGGEKSIPEIGDYLGPALTGLCLDATVLPTPPCHVVT